VIRDLLLKKISSKNSISAALPVFVVVALILVILAGYYVGTVLPASLPTTTTQIYTSYKSTLTGNYTSILPVGVSASPEHSVMVTYAVIYIVDGASLGREQAFNPNPGVVSLSKNATVIWKNADNAVNEILSTSCTPTPTCTVNMFKSTNMTAYSGSFTFKFNTTGTYNYQSLQYPLENGTITVVP